MRDRDVARRAKHHGIITRKPQDSVPHRCDARAQLSRDIANLQPVARAKLALGDRIVKREINRSTEISMVDELSVQRPFEHPVMETLAPSCKMFMQRWKFADQPASSARATSSSVISTRHSPAWIAARMIASFCGPPAAKTSCRTVRRLCSEGA